MKLDEILQVETPLAEAKMAWARKGKQVVRKFRCTTGRRAGRIVSTPAQCSAPPDMKKRHTLKKTKARMGARIARKAKKTKRINPASRRLKVLNRRR